MSGPAGDIGVHVQAAALLGEGLPGWEAARSVLAGITPYQTAPLALVPPPQLSPAERRRAIPSVKLALSVGMAAVAQWGGDPASLPTVFASSGADGETIDAILSALAAPDREVSPTRFHNSVHNAPSGYWSIAVHSPEPVTSLSGYDGSFAAGLLEAAAQAVSLQREVLLIAYDLPYPKPLNRLRPIATSFGAALVVSAAAGDRAMASLRLRICDGTPQDASFCADPGLEQLRRDNPAARSLPLLAALAAGTVATIRLEFGTVLLEVAVAPC